MLSNAKKVSIFMCLQTCNDFLSVFVFVVIRPEHSWRKFFINSGRAMWWWNHSFDQKSHQIEPFGIFFTYICFALVGSVVPEGKKTGSPKITENMSTDCTKSTKIISGGIENLNNGK